MATTWVQDNFRFRCDDGSETAAAWQSLGNNVNIMAGQAVNIRIRFDLHESGTTAATHTGQLQYNKNSAGWNNVTTASAVVIAVNPNASHFTQNAATTQQIGSGTFVAGKINDTGVTTATGSIAQNSHTEMEYCIQLVAGGSVNGDTIQLRDTQNGTAFGTYTNTPTVTVQNVTLITHASAINSDTLTATTAGIDTTGANFFIACMSAFQPTSSSSLQLTDSKSNTWHPLTARYTTLSTSAVAQLFWCAPTSVGTSHTFTAQDNAAAAVYPLMAVLAFYGMIVSPFDVENGASPAWASGTFQPGSITPAQSGELLVTSTADGSAGADTIGSSFIIAEQKPYLGAGYGISLAWFVQKTAAAINPTWTLGTQGGSQANNGFTIAAFKAAYLQSITAGQALMSAARIQPGRFVTAGLALMSAARIQRGRFVTAGQALMSAAIMRGRFVTAGLALMSAARTTVHTFGSAITAGLALMSAARIQRGRFVTAGQALMSAAIMRGRFVTAGLALMSAAIMRGRFVTAGQALMSAAIMRGRFVTAGQALMSAATTTVHTFGSAITAGLALMKGAISRGRFVTAGLHLMSAATTTAHTFGSAITAGLALMSGTVTRGRLILSGLAQMSASIIRGRFVDAAEALMSAALAAAKIGGAIQQALTAGLAQMSATIMRGRFWTAGMAQMSAAIMRGRFVTAGQALMSGAVAMGHAMSSVLTASLASMSGSVSRRVNRVLGASAAAFSAAFVGVKPLLKALNASLAHFAGGISRFISYPFNAIMDQIDASDPIMDASFSAGMSKSLARVMTGMLMSPVGSIPAPPIAPSNSTSRAPPTPQSLTRRGSLSVADIVSAQRATGSTAQSQNAEALQRLNQYSDLLNSNVNSLLQFAANLGPFIATLISFQTVPLLNPTNLVTPLVSAGSGLILVVAVEQDATGGRQITWDSNFRFAPTDIFGDPHTWSIFTFMSADVGSGLQWCMTTLPLTGVL